MESTIDDTTFTKRVGVTRALVGGSIPAAAGSIPGVLRPNGAVSSTAIRIITTLILPDVQWNLGR